MSPKSTLAGLISGTVLALDQVTKFLVDKTMAMHQSIDIIPNFASLTYLRNTGAAFGFLAGSRSSLRIVFFVLISSVAVGCIVFVLVGAPVGIWFSRADYLSAFVSCFLPTVVTYYPLLLSGMNLAKEGKIPSWIGLWGANVVVGIGAIILYARLLRR